MCCNSFPTFSRNQNTSDLDLGSRQVDTIHTYLHTYQLVWSPVDCSLTVGVNSETHYKILIKAKKRFFVLSHMVLFNLIWQLQTILSEDWRSMLLSFSGLVVVKRKNQTKKIASLLDMFVSAQKEKYFLCFLTWYLMIAIRNIIILLS